MLKKTLLVLSVALLAGCATAPPADFTIAEVQQAANPISGSLSAVSVKDHVTEKSYIEEGDSVYLIWREALTNALYQSNSFAGEGEKLRVDVKVYQLKSPKAGITMRANSKAEYSVIVVETGEVVWSETIETEGVVPGDYAFAGYVRAKESVNRAVRNSISEFISKLQSSDISIGE